MDSARSTGWRCSTSTPSRRARWWRASREVLLSRAGAVLTLRLNRPEARNALSPPMTRALHAALDEARDDPALKAVMVTGAGQAFSAGADLKELVTERPRLAQALERRELGALFRAIDAFPKPLVAAVNGDAMGAGFGLVAACHLAVATEGARFGLPGVRLGIMPMTIMPAIFRTLPRKLGLELMLTGRLMSAAEAFERGIVNRLVGGNDPEPAAAALAEEASNTPLTIPGRLTTL